MHLPGFSDDQVSTLAKAACRQEGTLEFVVNYPGLHDATKPDGVLFELVAGAHVFRLVRQEGRLLRGFHSSPGTGTRVASIELAELAPADGLHMFFMWTPDGFRLAAGQVPGTKLVEAPGEPSGLQLWLDDVGGIVQVGDEGVRTLGGRSHRQGVTVVSPPAIQLWRDTSTAVEILLTGTSDEGFVFESVLSGAALGMLVTGFETYSKTRFVEVEREGVPPNVKRLVQKCGSKDQRDRAKAGQLDAVLQELSASGESPAAGLAQQVNFQDFERAKTACAAADGLSFGRDLGLSSQKIARLKRLILYRHRVVHVSPMIGTLNLPEVPAEEPEFATKAFVENARLAFDAFVNALHTRTLRLQPPDTPVGRCDMTAAAPPDD